MSLHTEKNAEGKIKWLAIGILGAVAVVLGIGAYFSDYVKTPDIEISQETPTLPEIPEIDEKLSDSAVSEVVQAAIDEVRGALDSAEAWGKLGLVYMVHGHRQEGSVALESAYRRDPESGKWRYFQAICNLPEKMDEGIELLIEAKQLLENDGTEDELFAVRRRLANVWLENGRYDEAEREFESLLEEAPDNPILLLGLGQIRSSQGRLNESQELLMQCSFHPCTRKRTAQTLAVVLLKRGDPAGAEAARDRADGFPADQDWPDPFITLASTFRAGLEVMLEDVSLMVTYGRYAEAAPLVERIIEDYPESPFGFLIRADLLMREGDSTGAETALREVVKRDAKNVEAWMQLGLSLGRQQSYAESADCLRRVVELSPLMGEAHFNLGYALMSKGEDMEAVDAFENAIRYQPELADSYIAAAMIFEKSSEIAKAKQYLERGLIVNPGDVRATAALERLASKSKDSVETKE